MNKNNYLIDLSESNHTDFGRIEFSAQSEPQKVFSAIWALESQVNNGGFLQYFISSDYDTAEFAPEALRRIGADSCSAIVSRALRSLTPGALPASREGCESLVEALSEDASDQFDALDSEFFAYPDNLTELLYGFVAGHPEAFGPTPE
jgi:hypothetical protein